MAGRPKNKNREEAIFLGDPTYHGSVHDVCGTDLRYTSGGGCVQCARTIATEQRKARITLKAQAAGIDGRGDQGGGYPSSQGPLDKSNDDGLTDKQRFDKSIEDELF